MKKDSLCVKTLFGLDSAVEFTYCAEGPLMDDENLDADLIMAVCGALVIPDVDYLHTIEKCLEIQGRELEIENAKKRKALKKGKTTAIKKAKKRVRMSPSAMSNASTPESTTR